MSINILTDLMQSGHIFCSAKACRFNGENHLLVKAELCQLKIIEIDDEGRCSAFELVESDEESLLHRARTSQIKRSLIA